MTQLLFGKNPILEVFRTQRRAIYEFFYGAHLKCDSALKQALAWSENRQVAVKAVPKIWFEERFPQGSTQFWALRVEDYPFHSFETLLSDSQSSSKGLWLALDQIQDPQNLGAILRVAEASGVEAVITPTRRSVAVTPSVARASAGAVEYLKISQINNLTKTLQVLKKHGFWIVGTDLSASQDALSFKWPQKCVLVMGSEGKGMRPLVRKNCDFLVKIPLLGKIQSLNVSTATAVCVYQYLSQKF